MTEPGPVQSRVGQSQRKKTLVLNAAGLFQTRLAKDNGSFLITKKAHFRAFLSFHPLGQVHPSEAQAGDRRRQRVTVRQTDRRDLATHKPTVAES